jgi:two-component system sensor histidine kinase TctE
MTARDPSPAASRPAARGRRATLARPPPHRKTPRRPRHATGERIQRSLFGEILDWMLAPLLLLWPMSIAITYLIASPSPTSPSTTHWKTA